MTANIITQRFLLQAFDGNDIIFLQMKWRGEIFFMTLNKNSVEILAPAGGYESFLAAIDAGADAVYFGGKHFNMRVHNLQAFNFSNEEIQKAADFAHARGKKIYITLNNLISPEEIEPMQDYLKILDKIQPDALIVQDLAVINLVRKMNLNLNIHASVMMNINNSQSIELLKSLGVSRVVLGRELSLNEVSLLKEKTGMEIEYFVHGDMCVSVSGQCNHSGVTFGQSGSRGRCLKPCRWAWKFIDEESGEILDDASHKFAINDMCMLRKIPQMIQAGITSFKIEGRMRPPEFIHRIVSAYRKVVDDYISDPTGWSIDEDFWKDFFNQRVRNFSHVFAFSAPTKKDFGLSGKREPRFFSEGVVEKSFDDDSAKKIFSSERSIEKFSDKPSLNIRVSTLNSAKAAVENGANLIYIGGESFKPNKPLTTQEIFQAVDFAHSKNVKAVLNTPRVTTDKILSELAEQIERLQDAKLDGILVSNLGSLSLAKKFNLPIYADLSFNLFNQEAAEFLQKQGAIQAAASVELGFSQVRDLAEKSSLPIEILIHGAMESMICGHNFVKIYYPNYDDFETPEILNKHFALVDSAEEIHSIRLDQFEQSHIYFAKDLCLLPYAEKFFGAVALRIDAQDYSAEVTGLTAKIYRAALDGKNFADDFEKLQKISPRKFGCGVYHFKESKNS